MSYSIVYSESKKSVQLQLKTLVDTAALVTPVQYKKDGVPQGKPKFSLRCLLKADKCDEFRKEIAEACAKLCNGTTQVHPSFANNKTNPKYIVRDFLKIGREIIAEKKEADLHLKPTERKNYSPVLDYLEELCYFFASSSSEFPPKIFDKNGDILHVENDSFFLPSFIAVVRVNIKLISVPPTSYLTPYIHAVQYISPASINYRQDSVKFDQADDDGNMFGDVATKPMGFTIATEEQSEIIKQGKIVKESKIDSYLDEFV